MKDDLVKDACTQANMIATREGRETTVADKHFKRDVSYISYSSYLRLIISCRYVTLGQSGGQTLRRLSAFTCVNGGSALHRNISSPRT